jgi:hypothetical protein
MEVNILSRILIILVLLAVLYASRNWLPIPLFRLPGDFEIRTERFRFFFPLTTCLLISIPASLAFALFRSIHWF